MGVKTLHTLHRKRYTHYIEDVTHTTSKTLHTISHRQNAKFHWNIYRRQYLFIKPLRCCSARSVQKLDCCFIYDWLKNITCPVPYVAQPSDGIKTCVIYRPLRNRPIKPVCDVTFARRCLRGKQMTACEQIRIMCYGDWLWPAYRRKNSL